MKAPVIASDGNTYERDAISRWLGEKLTSPLTREVMTRDLTPNRRIGELTKYYHANKQDRAGLRNLPSQIKSLGARPSAVSPEYRGPAFNPEVLSFGP